MRVRYLFLVLVLGLFPAAAGAVGATRAAPAFEVEEAAVTFPSSSPFSLADVGDNPELAPATAARGLLFLPKEARAARSTPAVVLVHGAAGVSAGRELTQARRFASSGTAALVIDAFAARRDRATGFTERLLEITEAMLLADTFAGLRYLASLPEIDPERVAVIGFSYGAMVATYAAYAQVARSYAPDGLRFAGHVALYGPCVARFKAPRTTGAPVLMMIGGKDEITDRSRCAEIVSDLRSGGSRTELVVYEEAHHQWDAGAATPWRAGMNIASCRFEVDPSGVARDAFTGLAMSGPLTRRAILALCADRNGYLIGRNDAVREESDRAISEFLARIFAS